MSIRFQVKHAFTGDAVVSFGSYRNGRVAIELHGAPGSAYEGEPIGTITVNPLDLPLAEDEVAIKTYWEHTGILDPLVTAGVIEPQPRAVARLDYATVPIHRLTPAAWQQARAVLAPRPAEPSEHIF